MGAHLNMSDVLRAAREVRGAPDRIRKAIGTEAFDFGAKTAETAVLKYRSAENTTGSATRRRSGRLAGTISHRLNPGPPLSVEVGYMKGRGEDEALAYAATHEFGADISPKNAKFLAIPFEDALTAQGVPRGGPRDFPDTYIIPTLGGDSIFQFVIMQEQADGTALALFGLTRRTMHVPARPALKPAADEHLPDFNQALADKAAQLIFAGVAVSG